jgi:phage shock protein B
MRKFKYAVGSGLVGLALAIAVGAFSILTLYLCAAMDADINQGLIPVLGFGPPLVTIALVPFFAIVHYNLRYKHKGNQTPDETALVHELARRAQDLSQRMEALETILLDRTRATR